MRQETLEAVLQEVHENRDYMITMVGEYDDNSYIAGQALAVYQADCWEDIMINMAHDMLIHHVPGDYTEDEYKKMIFQESSIYSIVYEDDNII